AAPAQRARSRPRRPGRSGPAQSPPPRPAKTVAQSSSVDSPFPPLAGARAGGEIGAWFPLAHQRRGQVFIEAPRHHADAPRPHFLGLVAAGIDFGFEQIMRDDAGPDLLDFLHLLGSDIQGMADMGGWIALVLFLLDNALDIVVIETAKA